MIVSSLLNALKAGNLDRIHNFCRQRLGKKVRKFGDRIVVPSSGKLAIKRLNCLHNSFPTNDTFRFYRSQIISYSHYPVVLLSDISYLLSTFMWILQVLTFEEQFYCWMLPMHKYRVLSRAANFFGFKHKKSSVFVGFTSPKPITALTFFVILIAFRRHLNVRIVGFFVVSNLEPLDY